MQMAVGVLMVALLGAGAGIYKQDWLKKQYEFYVEFEGDILTPVEAGAKENGADFQECSICPLMVIVPAGEFEMGSPASEKGRDEDEDDKAGEGGSPVSVKIPARFAVGRFEVTWDEWEACVSHGDCEGAAVKRAGDDQTWGKGRRPVINVSWHDAQAYVGWLRELTGEDYRLLSETEWEYAARGGNSTRYPWGDDIGKRNANCNGCGSEWDNQKTAPVGQFPANPFGLHDMHGNVWEWVEDCYADSYQNAPTDGSTRPDESSCRRVLRGGSWGSGPGGLRSANRSGFQPDIRYVDGGFRVGRTLTP